jgi:hypothetical protein
MIGIVKLAQSAKATFALIVLIACMVVAIRGDMSMAFATCVGSITSVFMYVHSLNDRNGNGNGK